MYKLSFLALIAVLLFACTSENDVTTPTDTEVETKDTLISQKIDSTDQIIEEDAQIEFNVFEDYAQLRTKQELIDAFGKENVKHGSSWYAEGTVELKHTIIKNPANGHRIKYLWDQDKPTKLSTIEASLYEYDENYEIINKQEVRTNCGVYTGMTINELRAWNGEDFNFSGFGWDYEGGIFAEAGTRISKCPVGFKLTMEYNEGTTEEFRSLLGDIELTTKNELVKRAPIVINLMTYSIGE